MGVRSYELDAYGHVNHAVFLNYFENARVEYLAQKNMSFRSLMEEGCIFIIVRAEVDYIKPLIESERIDIVGGFPWSSFPFSNEDSQSEHLPNIRTIFPMTIIL